MHRARSAPPKPPKEVPEPPKPFRRTINKIYITDDQINISKHYPIDLDEMSSNLNFVKESLAKNYGITDVTILDAQFSEVKDDRTTRNELYWNIRNKFYFVDTAEWKSFVAENGRECQFHNHGFKKINYPIEVDLRLVNSIRPIKSAYYPVTGPATYRRNFVQLKIKNGQILKYQDVPFDLTDPMATIPSLTRIISEEIHIEDPVILDSQFREIRDSPTTRGFDFFSNQRRFYFINRQEWENFNNMSRDDCKFHLIKSKKINYPKYCDRRHMYYYKYN